MPSLKHIYPIVCHFTYLILLDEPDERRPLDFDWLPGPVVQRHHEVEKVRFPQIARGLLLEVSSTNPQAATKMERRHKIQTRC